MVPVPPEVAASIPRFCRFGMPLCGTWAMAVDAKMQARIADFGTIILSLRLNKAITICEKTGYTTGKTLC